MKRLKHFAGIVGQNIPVARLQESVKSAENGNGMLSPLIIGEAGKGKTALMRAYIDEMKERGFDTLFFSSPEEFRSDGERFDSLVQLIEGDKPYVIAIDEAHLFKNRATIRMERVLNFTMKALDKTNQGKPIQFDDNRLITFNRSKGSIVFATNFPNILDKSGALQSRFDTIVLDDYTEDELVEILQVMLQKVEMQHANPETLRRIARCGRGTARPLEKIIDQIKITRNASGEKRKTINGDDVLHALRMCKMYPRGLQPWEISILNRCKSAIRDNVLVQTIPHIEKTVFGRGKGYLIGQGLIKPTPQGLQRTDFGSKYLEKAEKEGFNVNL